MIGKCYRLIFMLSSFLYRPEEECVEGLLHTLDWDKARQQRVEDDATYLITAIRATKRKPGSLESFFQQYSLSTAEGIALMCLAEALLRIPDGLTAGELIRDKVSGTKWL